MSVGTLGAGPRVVADPLYSSSPFEPELPPVEHLEDIDVTDRELFLRGDPHATWRLLREKAPVFWHEKGMEATHGQGFWILARKSGFTQILVDSETFSNRASPLLDLTSEQFGGPAGLANRDRPLHPQMRQLIRRYLTPQAAEQVQDVVRREMVRLLDEAAAKGDECNFSSDVAGKVPPTVMAHFFGMDEQQAQVLVDASQTLQNSRTPADIAKYGASGLGLFQDLMVERYGREGDIIGDIQSGLVGGQPLTSEEALAYIYTIFLGALDSTVHAANAMLLTLFHHQSEFDRLTADPSLIEGSGINELLRWTSVSQHLKRQVTRDVEVEGQLLREGDFVCVFQASANRDEQAYPDPFRFDLSRSMSSIATFGHGTHLCPGLHLARLELRILFEELAKRYPRTRQVGPIKRDNWASILLPPITQLPVELRP